MMSMEGNTNALKHGMSNLPEYHAYNNARWRCQKKHHAAYHRYGARGIKFKFEDFEDFFAELGFRPTNRHSLDRIDNDGHYESGNVRWATPAQQSSNRRTTKQRDKR